MSYSKGERGKVGTGICDRKEKQNVLKWKKMEKGRKKVKTNKGGGKGRKEQGMTIINHFFSLENNPSLVLKYHFLMTKCLEINAAYILFQS
jgi:hypothetical protein